jgi:hypothetical protein
MSRRSRKLHLACEQVEPRALLSGVIASMATHPMLTARGSAASRGDSGLPQSQGPLPGATSFFQPTGTPTRHEVQRETFQFTLKGPYLVAGGRFDSQILSIYIRGAATSNFFLHGDGQIGLVVPADANALVSGQASLFDRNINANSAFGLDLAGDPAGLDAKGRPTHLTLSTDVNVSSGIFVESFSQGTVDIRYISSGRHKAGVIDQGTALVKIRGTAYTLGTANILRNVALNP